MFFFDEKCSLKKKNAKVQGSQVDYNLTENFKSSAMLLTPKSVLEMEMHASNHIG